MDTALIYVTAFQFRRVARHIHANSRTVLGSSARGENVVSQAAVTCYRCTYIFSARYAATIGPTKGKRQKGHTRYVSTCYGYPRPDVRDDFRTRSNEAAEAIRRRSSE